MVLVTIRHGRGAGSHVLISPVDNASANDLPGLSFRRERFERMSSLRASTRPSAFQRQQVVALRQRFSGIPEAE